MKLITRRFQISGIPVFGLLWIALHFPFWGIQGQSIDPILLNNFYPRSIGPAAMSGRVTSLDVHPKNKNTILAGTASGGLWLSTSGGTKWSPLFDKESCQAIGAAVFHPLNPSLIWVGTGEGNPRNSHNYGNGIYKSLDEGKTWIFCGLENSKQIHRIRVHPRDENIAFAGVTGNAWADSPERGVFRTKDGGKTWEKILYINESTGCAELVMDPNNPNRLIASMWEHRRKPWTFNSGGKSSGMYLTVDGGNTWKKITDKKGIPAGDLGRMGFAFAASKPGLVYGLIEAKTNGLYKSLDGGENWTKVSEKNIGDRPFYYCELYVDPKNENRIFNIYTYVSKSEDGGKTFESISGWRIHPDHHAMYIHPEDPSYIINGNDGGLNISRDGGNTWDFASNIPVGQFYHINYDFANPYNVYGGLQDNGSWVGPSSVWRSGGIRSSDWQEVMFGDGFDVVPNRGNDRYGMAMYQGGNLGMYDRNTGKEISIKPIHPELKNLRFNWNAAIAQDPFRTNGVYFGSQYVHYTPDFGKNWILMSDDLTTNDTTKQKQDLSGGLTPDATAAENHCTILSIAPSPRDSNVIWVGTDDGNLRLTKNKGKNWNEIFVPGMPKNAWIPQIHSSNFSDGEAWVVVNHYRMGDARPMLFYTNDFGRKWSNIVNEKEIKGHCLSFVQDPYEPKLLFLGTEFGMYVSFDKGQNWTKWTNHNFPSTPVSDLKIHPRENDLIIGTFGRSIYILDDIVPLRQICKDSWKNDTSKFKIFPSQETYAVEFGQPFGERFEADGAFKGRNKNRGSQFTFWIPRPKKDDSKKKEEKSKSEKKTEDKDSEKKSEKNKIKLVILSENKDTIRNLTFKVDSFYFQRNYWGLESNGIKYPSYSESKKDDDVPGGIKVEPGIYQIRAFYNDQFDSTYVKVNSDPRVPYIPVNKERKLARGKHNELISSAKKAFDRLKEAEKITTLQEEMSINLPDSTKTKISKLGGEQRDSIKLLQEIFMLPKDIKGLHHFKVYLTGHLDNTEGLLNQESGPLSNTEKWSMEKSKIETEKMLEKVNAYFSSSWVKYREKIESLKSPVFKDYVPIKIN
jgi:photosystem II stability/assembly factor-like uncharacterized protein